MKNHYFIALLCLFFIGCQQTNNESSSVSNDAEPEGFEKYGQEFKG